MFTEERRASILKDISDRIPYELAAEANGICEETLYAWIRQGKLDKKNGIQSEFAKFSEDIKRTELKKIREHLDSINESPERWQAQAWILERRWWKHFSPNAAVLELNKRLELIESEKEEDDGEINHESP
jgi:transposase-like protein